MTKKKTTKTEKDTSKKKKKATATKKTYSKSSAAAKKTSSKASSGSKKTQKGTKKTSKKQTGTKKTAAKKTSSKSSASKAVSSEKKTSSTSSKAADKPENKYEAVFKDDVPKESRMSEAPLKPVKKRRTGAKVFFIMLLLIAYSAVAITGFYLLDKNILRPDTFPEGTKVNGVDVSGLNIAKAKDKLTKKWNKRSLSIIDEDGKKAGTISKLDLEYDINDSLMAVLKPDIRTTMKRLADRNGIDATIDMTPAGPSRSFNKAFRDLEIVKKAKGDRKSENAYVDKSDTEFRIVKEVYGNGLDKSKLKEAMLDAVSEGDDTFEFVKSDYYEEPKIKSTSKKIKEEQEYCKKYLSFKVFYRNAVNEYTITPDWLNKMIKVDEVEDVYVKKTEVNNFVSTVIAPKFSSTGATRKLKSAGGGWYKVTGGTYGYTVDVDKEVKKLSTELKKRTDIEREPIYEGKVPTGNPKNDIGKDYVEISIGKQMVWVVRKGKVVVKTPVVTGNTTDGHATPTGTYYIVYKQTNTVLRGRNSDGSEYESPVSFWAPFYLGYGLHDASWRGAFGGSIYQGGGSHGCVNCPPAVMPKIFSNLYEGMPCIVH